MNCRAMQRRRTVIGHVLRRNPEYYPDVWIGECDMPGGGRRMFSFRKVVSRGQVEWQAQLNGKGQITYFHTLVDAVRWHLQLQLHG